MAKGRLEFKASQNNQSVAYLSLPDHPGEGVSGVTAKQLRLLELCGDYKGPDVYFDFDSENRLVGIEILVK